MTLAAYYYPPTRAQKARGQTGYFEAHKLDNGRREIVCRQGCNDRRHAREMARVLNATPWNF